MPSTIELMNDMRHQMDRLMHSHKKTTEWFVKITQKVQDQTDMIARLEREKRFTDASFRRIYSEFSDYRSHTDLRIEELTKDLDDHKNILTNLSHIMWGDPDQGSGDQGSGDQGSGDQGSGDQGVDEIVYTDPEDSDVILETNEQEDPYIIYNNIIGAVVNNRRNLYNVSYNVSQTDIPAPPRLRRGSVGAIIAPPPVPRFIAPEGVEIPNEFLCPITLEIMQDPVILSDGNTYERFAILQHISMDASPQSPLTRNLLESNILISNNNLMKMIEDFCTQSSA